MKDALGHGSNPSGNAEAASKLASGRKSAKAPLHDAMAADKARQIGEAESAMYNLKQTFHAGGGSNRGGEYGRNVRKAYERQAQRWSKLTGKPAPHIYDR